MNTPLIGLPLFGIGVAETIIIGALVLILFGATRLPKLGRGMGEGIRNFKTSIKGRDKSPMESMDDAAEPASSQKK